MIDVIIPVYNANNTLPLTLMSIMMQNIECNIKVTLIDDCSDDDYSETIETFSKYFKIGYYRLNKNSGGGVARQKGIDITNGEYIIFIDADDLLYNVDSLNKLYKKILDGYDMVSGGTYDESRNFLVVNEGDLHGKLYRRKYLIEKDIKFNATRFHEDNYFNNLVLLSGAQNHILLELVYIYCNNKNSTTNNSKELEFNRLEIMLSNVKELMDRITIDDSNKKIVVNFLVNKYKYYNKIYKDFSEEKKNIFKSWINKYDPNNINLIGIEDVSLLEKLIKEKIM